MNQTLDHELELALEQMIAGEHADEIVAGSELSPDQDSLLKTAQLLVDLRPVSLPSLKERQQDRQAFLAQAVQILPADSSQSAPTETNLRTKINQWLSPLLLIPALPKLFQRKETQPMMFMFSKAVLILFIVLSAGAGSLTAATANSLPDTPLYPLKQAYEQLRLDLTKDPVQQANFHLVQAQTRINEFVRQVERGSFSGGDAAGEIENHFNQALNIGLELTDSQLQELLRAAEVSAQDQEKQMDRLQIRDRDRDRLLDSYQECKQVLSRVREMTAAGLQDPQVFRYRYANGWDQADPQPEDSSNQIQNQLGPDPNAEDPPAGEGSQYQHGPGPANDDPPAQEGHQHQYGPGPGEDPPAGEGSQNQYGPGPSDDPPAGEGSQNQYGPGPSDDPPAGEGEQNQYGPGPSDDPPSEEGEQNQYGPGPSDDPPADEGEQNQNGAGSGDCDQSSSCGSNDTNSGGGSSSGSGQKP